MTSQTTRKFKFTKFGIAEDPRGAQVAWTCAGRRYLADVVDAYRCEVRGATMLKVRHFCGDEAPEVCARIVDVLGWSSAARGIEP